MRAASATRRRRGPAPGPSTSPSARRGDPVFSVRPTRPAPYPSRGRRLPWLVSVMRSAPSTRSSPGTDGAAVVWRDAGERDRSISAEVKELRVFEEPGLDARAAPAQRLDLVAAQEHARGRQ